MDVQFQVWNTCESRPATPDEIDALVKSEQLFINYSIVADTKRPGRAFVDLRHGDYELIPL